MKVAQKRTRREEAVDDGGYPPLTLKQLARIAKRAPRRLGKPISSSSLFDEIEREPNLVHAGAS